MVFVIFIVIFFVLNRDLGLNKPVSKNESAENYAVESERIKGVYFIFVKIFHKGVNAQTCGNTGDQAACQRNRGKIKHMQFEHLRYFQKSGGKNNGRCQKKRKSGGIFVFKT